MAPTAILDKKAWTPKSLAKAFHYDDARWAVNPRSSNDKTGPIAVTTSPAQTCPDSCPFKGKGCFGENYGINFGWNALTKGDEGRGYTWDEFIAQIMKLRPGILGRHNQVGDLPGENESIDEERLDELTSAFVAKKKKFWTYSHKELTELNLRLMKSATDRGFTINVSCETPEKAMKALEYGLPAVLAVPESYPKRGVLPNGHPVMVCPAQLEESERSETTPTNCLECKGLCWVKSAKRPVIAFRAHGNQKRKIEMVLRVMNEGS